MAVDLNDRVSTLERVLERYIENSQNTLDSLSREMREFKDEMKEFKDEIRMDTENFKNAIQSDTKSLKDEMKEFKDKMEKDRREMNKKWGNLANKMGTLVEDIFIPGVKETVWKYFDDEINSYNPRRYIRNRETGEEGEFDVIAVTDLYVFLVEVKTTPNNRDVDRLITKIVPKFRRLTPYYEDKIVIPILGSLSFPSKMIPYASKAGVYLLGYREWDYLDFLNFDEVSLPENPDG